MLALSLIAATSLAACGDKPEAEAGKPADTAATAPAASALTLDANNLPKFREGLWEAVQTEDDGTTESTQHCVGPEIDAELRELLTNQTPGCQTKRSVSPAALKIDAICDQAGMKTESNLALTGSETSYDMKIGIYLVKPDGAREGGESVVKAKWVGACPAGMKPGDEVEK